MTFSVERQTLYLRFFCNGITEWVDMTLRWQDALFEWLVRLPNIAYMQASEEGIRWNILLKIIFS